MKNTLLVCFAIFLFITPGHLIGQNENSGETFLARSSSGRFGNMGLGGLSLLDPSKLSMSQSYSMSFSSSGGKGGMVGLYMNTMNYRFSEPLSVTVHVGYLHQPFGGNNANGVLASNSVLSGFELTYRPKENLFLKIEYGMVPVYNGLYSRHGSWYDW